MLHTSSDTFNADMHVLATLGAMPLADLTKKPGLSSTTLMGLEAIHLRLAYELSGRPAKSKGDLDLSMAYTAVLRMPCGSALCSLNIRGLEVELAYVPAHLATLEHEDANQPVMVFKITRTGEILRNSMAADEFQTVWNACCAGTEEIIVGVKTFGELVPKASEKGGVE